ncbi:hypothetical protein D3C80_2068640 [compost metagenome]
MAVAVATSFNRFSAKSRVSGSRVRTVPVSVTEPGMTLPAVPPWVVATVTTSDFNGSVSRETMDCRAMMI